MSALLCKMLNSVLLILTALAWRKINDGTFGVIFGSRRGMYNCRGNTANDAMMMNTHFHFLCRAICLYWYFESKGILTPSKQTSAINGHCTCEHNETGLFRLQGIHIGLLN